MSGKTNGVLATLLFGCVAVFIVVILQYCNAAKNLTAALPTNLSLKLK